MELYEYYKTVRDLAWQILIDFNLTKFPIDIFDLTRKLGIYANAIQSLPLESAKSIGFAYNGKTYIGYIPTADPKQDRFNVAHELGHILRGHLTADAPPIEYEEEQANMFAARILMPLIVIHEEKLFTIPEIMNFFGVTEAQAKIRLERYNFVKPRNMFCSSPFEKHYRDIYFQSKK